MIEVKNITKIYGKKPNTFKVLDNVSLTIERGESVAILGKSGSGKSTLMHVISGLDRPQEGQVLIDGKNILTLKDKQMDEFRAKNIGFVFQSFYIQGNETVYDNVSLPLEATKTPRNARKVRVYQTLKSVELHSKVNNKAMNLSGGQKQRLAIARAIANNPDILFADEPTGNLDSITSKVVEELLFSYNRDNKTTLIIVTHDPELAAKCDKIINIKDGRIIETSQ